MLFGINQGGDYEDLRVRNMKQIAALDLAGYGIGGLAVGEPTEVMYRILEAVEPWAPKNRPRYLMGVGTPSNIIKAGETSPYSLTSLTVSCLPAMPATHVCLLGRGREI